MSEYQRDKGRSEGWRVRRRKKYRKAKRLIPTLALARRDGARSYAEIAAWLREHNFHRPKNKPWTKSSLYDFCQIEVTQYRDIDQEHAERVQNAKDHLDGPALEKELKAFESQRLRKMAMAKRVGELLRTGITGEIPED